MTVYKIHVQELEPVYHDCGYTLEYDNLEQARGYLNNLEGFIFLTPSGEIGYQLTTKRVFSIVRENVEA